MIRAKRHWILRFATVDGDANETAILELLQHAAHKSLPLTQIMSDKTLKKAVQWAKDKNNRTLQEYLFLRRFKKAYMAAYRRQSIFRRNPFSTMKGKLDTRTIKEVEEYAKANPHSRIAKVLSQSEFLNSGSR